MTHFKGAPLSALIRQMFSEYKHHSSIFNYPALKIFRGYDGYDFSVKIYEHKAYTPLGPAAGPHTQLAQNILLSFLGGSRIIELKTIQILDNLTIPRPCIDMRNIGFNVEWSQELRLEESLREYVKAWLLLHILRESEILGIDKDSPFYNTIFDISVGYNLEGISSEPVTRWIESIKYAKPIINELLEELPTEFSRYRNIKINPNISQSLTLSTFHGCPSDEIEAIVRHLITRHKLHVIVKMNPTLLGYDFVQELLINQLGYHHLQLDKEAFNNDLKFDEAIAMVRRLHSFALKENRTVGVKFTNTLVVKNNETVFREPLRYLSGPPLYALAMHTMHTFREKLNLPVPVSYSGGINKDNFSDAVSCNMVPVTTCSDLLKKGGYTKLFSYMQNLKNAMEKLSAHTINEFVTLSAGNTSQDMWEAGRNNSAKIIDALNKSSAYSSKTNSAVPKKIGSQLKLFDCLSCDICLPVCPNAANFHYKTDRKPAVPYRYHWQSEQWVAVSEEDGFRLEKEWQIGNIAEFCNDCGNCDTFCPEDGGPYLRKPRFFIYRSSFDEDVHLDGFHFVRKNLLLARFESQNYTLEYIEKNRSWIWQSPEYTIALDADGHPQSVKKNSKNVQEEINLYLFFVMKTVMMMFHTPHLFPQYLLLSV